MCLHSQRKNEGNKSEEKRRKIARNERWNVDSFCSSLVISFLLYSDDTVTVTWISSLVRKSAKRRKEK